MSLMGLDIGTTGTKAIIFDLDANILSSAYREYDIISPREGWLEVDPNEIWPKVTEAVREAVSGTRATVKAVAISCLGEAAAPVSKDGEFLRRSILGFDNRCKYIEDEWREKYDLKELMEISGMPPSQMYTIFKIKWIKDHQPGIYEKVWKFLCYEDLAIYKMTEETAVDYSVASRTMAFDVRKKKWSEKICDIAGIDVSIFPNVHPSGTVVGEVTPAASEELGLPNGCKVVTGGHDQPAAALGAGITTERVAIDATGTVECFVPAFAQPVLNEAMLKSNFCCYPHLAPDLYVTLAFNFTGGSLLKWFRDNFAAEEKRIADEKGVDVYDVLMDKMDDEPTNIFVLPHFTSTGTPHMDPDPTGAIVGLRLETTKQELTKAVLEGITYEMKLNLQLLEEAGVHVDELRAVGGGAKSEKWLQLKADMFNKRIVRLNVSEAACLGVAISAGVAIGEYKSYDEALEHVVRPDRSFEPNAERAAIYGEKLETYRKIYPALRGLK